MIGKSLFMDKLTTSQSRVTFARICVEIKDDNPLPKTINLTDEEGTEITQEVIYDWLPKMCSKCKTFGHDCNSPAQAVANITKSTTKQAPKGSHKSQPVPNNKNMTRPHLTRSTAPQGKLANAPDMQENHKLYIRMPHRVTQRLTVSGQNKFALLQNLGSEGSVGNLSPKQNFSIVENRRKNYKNIPRSNRAGSQRSNTSEEENEEELGL